jgi:hypothetical protein
MWKKRRANMGYRSDVVALLYTNKPEDLPLLKLWLTANFPLKTFEKSIKWFDRGIILKEEHVKWYDDDKDVLAFNEAVYKFVEEFCEAKGAFDGAYEFMRIGESDDDIESDCCGDYDYILSCERSIHINIQGV